MFVNTLIAFTLLFSSALAVPLSQPRVSSDTVSELVDSVLKRDTTTVPSTVSDAFDTLEKSISAVVAPIDLSDIDALVIDTVTPVLVALKGAIDICFGTVNIGDVDAFNNNDDGLGSREVRDAVSADSDLASTIANTLDTITSFMNALPAKTKADPGVASHMSDIDTATGGLLSAVATILEPIVAAVADLVSDLGLFAVLKALGLPSIVAALGPLIEPLSS